MRKHCAALLATLWTVSCAKDITIGKDPDAAEAGEEKPTGPKRYRVAMPTNHSIYTPMFLEMMKALNEGVGFEMMILPAPLYKPTTEFLWVEEDAKTGDVGCVGKPLESNDPAWPALAIELNINYAKTFWNSKAPLAETPLYKLFLHCIGHGMGFLHEANNPLDIMGTDITKVVDLTPFYERVKALHQPAP